MKTSLELIREQFGACAVVLTIEKRNRPNDGSSYVAMARPPLGSEAEDEPGHIVMAESMNSHEMSELFESCHHASATDFGTERNTCYRLVIFRSLSHAPFDNEEKSVCELLVSHLARGLEMASRIGATEIERTLYSDVVDRLSVGVVILDRAGKVVRISSTADEILTEGSSLRIQGGHLYARCSNEDRELQSAIKAALQDSRKSGASAAVRGLSLTKQSGSKNLGLIVRPINVQDHRSLSASSAVAVFLRDSEAVPDIEGELVRQLFDLTPAEAAVARRLTVGLSLDEAANSLDISRNTARAHLRSIFSKSGITRQTELVRLVLNSVVLLGERPRQAI
ncbi:helix-turn-helix transcriptional regulator [Microvirga puerhi]|uniref:Helix-turn-helix transcriptional regulator n=1 Tax=Microvirga puerhi TaxID=2876078 RepID=A0ABS7VUN6_9HYPH|nr:helix-turn-helix transcriptional regulator [Microvirga puerhi]MBZ6079303.1 helix-turn-helix transcriptional regulator [Microvirga puerhi]